LSKQLFVWINFERKSEVNVGRYIIDFAFEINNALLGG